MDFSQILSLATSLANTANNQSNTTDTQNTQQSQGQQVGSLFDAVSALTNNPYKDKPVRVITTEPLIDYHGASLTAAQIREIETLHYAPPGSGTGNGRAHSDQATSGGLEISKLLGKTSNPDSIPNIDTASTEAFDNTPQWLSDITTPYVVIPVTLLSLGVAIYTIFKPKKVSKYARKK